MRSRYGAIALAVLAAYLVSTAWYVAFAGQLVELGSAATGRPSPWKVVLELVRTVVVATALAGFAQRLRVADWKGAVQLAVAVWIGFAVVLYAGAVMWEDFPWQLAAIHAGDWLVKTTVIAVIVTSWRRPRAEGRSPEADSVSSGTR